MLPQVRMSFESKCVAYLIARGEREDGNAYAPATGFFWRSKDRVLLVTNRHVVTGRDLSGEPIENGFDVLHLDAFFWAKNGVTRDGFDEVEYKRIRFHLWSDGSPDWLEKPGMPRYDIAAIDLGRDFDVFAVNDKEQRDDIWLEAGADCFIVGFPEKLTGQYVSPVWKRASIASEPQLQFNEEPVFLCDTATRPGMSGSPVFLRAIGDFGREGEPRSSKIFGCWTKFIGVYAGRNGNVEDGFQLGRVWNKSAFDEFIDSAVRAHFSF